MLVQFIADNFYQVMQSEHRSFKKAAEVYNVHDERDSAVGKQ